MLQLIIDSKFNSTGVKEAEARVMRLAEFIEREMQTTAGADNFLANQQTAINSQETINALQQQIAKVEQLAAAYKNAAVQQYSLGNIQQGDRISAYGSSLERTAENMRSLTSATEQNTKETENQDGVLDLINNKFNKFAFGLFVLQGTIGTITRLINQMFNALLDGASIADRANSFNVLIENAGMSAEALKSGLIGASQGALTLDAAMRPTLQLMKAGVPEVAGMSDELLKIAVASATLSGDLSQTEHMYTTLVRGIVRGSPLLIDNADIYLKLGDAVESYAKSMGTTVDQLTPEDRIRATAQAVAEQGQEIVDLADEVQSTALVYQRMKTDATEAWQAISSAASEGIAKAIDARREAVLTAADLRNQLKGMSEEQLEFWRRFNEIKHDQPLRLLAEGLVYSSKAIFEIIKFIIASMKDLNQAIIETSQVAARFMQIWGQLASGAISAEEALRLTKEMAIDTANALADGLDPTEHWEEAMKNIAENGRDAAANLGLIPAEIDNIASSTDSATASMSNAFDELSAGIQAAIEARTGLDAQFADKREDIEENLAEKIIDINEDLADKLADISSGLQDKLLDINTKYKEDVADLAKDTAEELSNIDEDLADKLAEATETATKSREDAYKDRNKGIEDAQEKHQQKLLDIERKYEASRLKALIDRDARALFEAEQARKQGQQEAADDLSDQIKDEEDGFKERMETIKEQEEERRAKAIEDAAKRRQDALDAQADELKDLKDNLQKQKQEAVKAAQEQRREAIKSANEKRRDAQEAQRDALQDLDEWYREQLTLQKERQLQEKINELEHLEEMGELTQAHLDELRGMWNDYNGFVSSTGVPGGSSTGGSSGSSQTPVGSGGGTGGSLGGAQNNSTGGAPTWIGPNGLRLNIHSNDSTLQDVLRSGTYEYILEALGE